MQQQQQYEEEALWFCCLIERLQKTFALPCRLDSLLVEKIFGMYQFSKYVNLYTMFELYHIATKRHNLRIACPFSKESIIQAMERAGNNCTLPCAPMEKPNSSLVRMYQNNFWEWSLIVLGLKEKVFLFEIYDGDHISIGDRIYYVSIFREKRQSFRDARVVLTCKNQVPRSRRKQRVYRVDSFIRLLEKASSNAVTIKNSQFVQLVGSVS